MNSKKLIVLYGKPGVGKLTIARHLAKMMSVPVLHSHLTSDLVYSIFTRGDSQGSILKQQLRLKVLDAWGEFGDKSIIITQLYKKGKNENYFSEMTEVLSKHGFVTNYFHLKCEDSKIKMRLESDSRKEFGKLTKWGDFLQKSQKNNMNENLPVKDNYEIDTTQLTAEESAQEIFHIISDSL